MSERRFTDKEVSLILRRASDLENRGSSTALSSGRGLTLSALKEIAAEAGIDPDLVGRAVAEMESSKGLKTGSTLLGPGTVRREVRATSGEMATEKLAKLIRVVDEEVSDQGTIQEALGQIRWTSQGRILSTQVSLEPGEGETLIRVEERYHDALRGMLYGIPSGYGLVFGLIGALEGFNLGFAPGAALTLASFAAGWGLGGSIWRTISSRSRKRVQRLTEKLGIRATELAQEGGDGSRGNEPKTHEP